MAKIKIKKSNINNISFEDEIFSTLKNTYDFFDKWINKLKTEDIDVYYTEKDNRLTSIMILKIGEIDSQQFFEKGSLLKIRTLMVLDKNKGIGTLFLKIVEDVAKESNIDFIYLTIKEKNYELTRFVEKNNYNFYSQINDELVYYKKRDFLER